MLHNFMLAAREAGLSMRQYRESPQAIANAFIQAVETYKYDGVLVELDTATLAGAVGVPIDFPEDLPARCCAPRLKSLDEVWRLEHCDISAYRGVQVWLEATRLLCKYFGDEIWIRGNCDQSPFSLACAMRGIEEWMTDLTDQGSRQAVECLLNYCTGITSQFVELMAATGAHMISNGDSLAGPELIRPEFYRTFALPWEKIVVDLAHQRGLPYMLHICGKTDRILGDMAATGADALELDHRTNLSLAHATLRDRCVFVGNLDPSGVLCLGTPLIVEEKTKELLAVFHDTPRLIVNAGCAIPATTPRENLRAMVTTAHNSRIEQITV